MAHPVLIETPRLILRTVTMEDIGAVASSWKLDEEPISFQEAQDKIAWMLRNHEQNKPGKLVHFCLTIIHKETQQIIGWCGLDNVDPGRENPVLFYLLKAGYWGQGLATEAARALIQHAFTALDLVRIDSATAKDNIASKRVMEKIGMRYVGFDHEGGYFFTLGKHEYTRLKADQP